MSDNSETVGGDVDPAAAEQPHWFWGPFLGSKGLLAQVVLAATVSNVLALSSSLFIMVVYDKVIPNNAMDSLVALVVGMVIVIVSDYVLKNLRGYFIDIVGRRADTVIGRALFRQLLTLDLAARHGGSTGSYANTVKEFDTLRDFFASATVTSLVDLPFVLFFVWVIWMIGGPVALVLVIAVPTVLIYAGVIQPLLSRHITRTFREGAAKQGVLVEAVGAMETIRSVGGADFMTERWDESVNRQSESAMRTRLTAQTATNLAGAAQQAVQVGIVFYGALLMQEGAVTMGSLVACVILSGRCMGPLSQVAGLLTRAQHAVAAYRSIDRLMKLPSAYNSGRNYLRRERVQGRIEFRNVTFRYPGAAVRALDDVSFVVEPGEKLAILGRIGSGKSTIVRLAMGLYEPDEGQILIDDTDIRQFHPDDRRRHMGALLQDSQLLSGTIRENIAIGADHPSDDDILHAAAVSGAHDFVGHLPSGYDLRISERGEGLSGGQRQALGFARALVGRPRFLMLDEPTSALDTRSESALIGRLRTAIKDKTVLLVTHKSSLLDLADKVLIVDGGKVVTLGSKAEVMARLAQGERAGNGGRTGTGGRADG